MSMLPISRKKFTFIDYIYSLYGMKCLLNKSVRSKINN